MRILPNQEKHELPDLSARIRVFRFLALVLAMLLSGCQFEEVPLRDQLASKVEQSNPEIIKTANSKISAETPIPQSPDVAPYIPDWVTEAIFYQIFPERFRNGDPNNDPTRSSLEPPISVPETWEISSWTDDWYARVEWEQQTGNNFYEHGVFNRRYGGDLQGVLDKLDYIRDLGINAIYFNPVFYGKSLHKYDSASMHHIDPYFGPDPAGDLELIRNETGDPQTWHWTAADKLFLELIQAAHERGIRLIIDGVFNHTGRDFFAFTDLVEKQDQSEYQDWYIVHNFDNTETDDNEFKYKSWWGYESLPEFADDISGQDLHPGPKQYVFNITRRWMDPDSDGDPSDGIDGWRLDVANEVPIKFWRDWNVLVRELNPAAYTVGEFWGEARKHLVEGRFSGTMNYHGFAYLAKGFLIDGTLSSNDFAEQLEQRRKVYPAAMQSALQNLIDSHDTDRMASMIVNARPQHYMQPDRFDFDVSERVSPRNDNQYDVRAPNQHERQIQRLVALMQITYIGAPMVYYGTEAGMWGGDDPCDRMPMVWDDLDHQDQTHDPLGRPREADTVEFNPELFEFYRQIIHLRRNSPALNHGSFKRIDIGDAPSFIAFQRSLDDENLIVAINRGENPIQWHVPQNYSSQLRPIFATSVEANSIEIREESDSTIVSIPALNGVVFADQATGE